MESIYDIFGLRKNNDENDEIAKENDTEIISEITIYRSDDNEKMTFSIHVDPDKHRMVGYLGDPYIKVCNATNWDTATKSIRISMRTGRPIRSHADGKKELEFSSKLRRALNNAMTSRSTNKEYSGLTVYDAIYETIKYFFENEDNFDQYYEKYPCPIF